MRVIAHRGNLNGPDPVNENSPNKILECLNKNIDVEIDVRMIDSEWWLGHDEPLYKINEEFFFEHGCKLWIHCKNFRALEAMNGKYLNYFWHDSDDHVLTSKKYIWTFPGKEVGKHNVIVMPEKIYTIEEIKNLKCYGICTDYVLSFL